MGVVVTLWVPRFADGAILIESIRYQPQLFWIWMVFSPALSRTWPAGTVVQLVVAGSET